MLTSGWRTATIPTGETVSNELDLDDHYENALIIAPDLTTDTTYNVAVSKTSGGTFVNLEGVAPAKQKAAVVRIGGARFLKIVVVTAQAEDRDFDILGF